jgi:RNA polymerase sigma-70 factor (ECF subfamily)
MTDDDANFLQFISRVRAGDQQAAADLVARYESLIRREIRQQLDDRSLARAFDSMDICQSVLASFFVRTAAGEYDIVSSVQLVNLLINMARNKLISAARREYRQRRDLRRSKAEALIALDQVPDGKQTAAEEIEVRDLLNRIYERFTPEELWIARLRNNGATWENVAAEVGGSAHSRRMQFSRALERVADEIGLDFLS